MASPENPLRLALCGAGTFATSTHFPILSSLQDAGRVKVNLVWSRHSTSASALAAKYGTDVAIAHAESTVIGDGSPDTVELLSAISALEQHRRDLDAVILCVPIPQNASFAQAALSLGLHVLCEKPLAHDIPAANSLLQFYYKINNSKTPVSDMTLFGVAENFRFEEAYIRARDMIPSTCGRLLGLTLHAQTPMLAGSRYAFGWRLKLPGPGILADGFVHTVAGLRMLAKSDVATVSASCVTNASHFHGADTSSAVMTFLNGTTASIFVSFAAGVFHWELTAVGEIGDVILRRVPGKPGYALVTRNKQGETSEDFVKFSGIDREFDAFVTSCQKGSIDEKLCASAAFNDIATVHCMHESSSEHRIVNVPEPPCKEH